MVQYVLHVQCKTPKVTKLHEFMGPANVEWGQAWWCVNNMEDGIDSVTPEDLERPSLSGATVLHLAANKNKYPTSWSVDWQKDHARMRVRT